MPERHDHPPDSNPPALTIEVLPGRTPQDPHRLRFRGPTGDPLHTCGTAAHLAQIAAAAVQRYLPPATLAVACGFISDLLLDGNVTLH